MCVTDEKRFLGSSITTLWSHSLRGDGVCEVCIIVYTRVLLFRVFLPPLLVWWEPSSTTTFSDLNEHTLFAYLYTQGVCISFSMIYQYTLFAEPRDVQVTPVKLELGTPAGCSSPGVLQLVGRATPSETEKIWFAFRSGGGVLFRSSVKQPKVSDIRHKIHFSLLLLGAPAPRGRSRCWWCVVSAAIAADRGEWGWSGQEKEVLFLVLAATLVITLFIRVCRVRRLLRALGTGPWEFASLITPGLQSGS